MAQQRDQLIQDVGDSMVQFKRAMHLFAFNNFTNLGLTPAQLGLLRSIYCSQPITPKQLAKHMQMTPGAISQQLEGLEEADYVVRTRNEADRRTSYLSISRRGKRLMDEYGKLRNQLFSQAFAEASDQDLQTYIRVQQQANSWLETNAKKTK